MAKTQVYGMWVDKTYYEEILLNGKIPGSTSSPNSGINMACIYNIGAIESTIPQEEIKIHTCNNLEVSSDSNIKESPNTTIMRRPKINVAAQISHTNSKQLRFQSSSNVLVKSQYNINCPTTSPLKFNFVSKICDFYSFKTTFSRGLQKFKVGQNGLFRIFIFMLIIGLSIQLYSCPLWSPVVSKAFDRQSRSSRSSKVSMQSIFGKTSILNSGPNVAQLCNFGAGVLSGPSQVNLEVFQPSSQINSMRKTSLSISSKGFNYLNCVRNSLFNLNDCSCRNFANNWTSVTGLETLFLDFSLFLLFYLVLSIKLNSLLIGWFSTILSSRCYVGFCNGKVPDCNFCFATRNVLNKFKQSCSFNRDNPSGMLGLYSFKVPCDCWCNGPINFEFRICNFELFFNCTSPGVGLIFGGIFSRIVIRDFYHLIIVVP